MYMTTSILRTARFTLLLVASFALGVIAITIASIASGKNGLWQKLGVSSPGGSVALADTSCEVPGKDTSNEVYFVSCGGFF